MSLSGQIKKNLVDQPLHALWAATVGLAPTVTPWALFYSIPMAAFIIWREWRQWPSTRPYDPWLDWSFYVLGLGGGISTGIFLL